MAAHPKAFWPLVINDTNKAVGNKTVALGTYYSAASYLAAVAAAFGAGYTVIANTRGRVTIAGPGAFTMDLTGQPSAALLGFAAISHMGASSYTGPRQHANAWYADRGIGQDLGPEFDSPSVATVSLSGVVKTTIYPERELRTLIFANIPSHKAKVAFENPGLDGLDHTGEALERLWRAGRARFRYWPDGADDATYVDLCFFDNAIKDFKPTRHPRKALYGLTWNLRKFVEG